MTGKEYVEQMDAIADAIGTKDFSIRYMENAYREPLKQIPGTDIFVSALMLMHLEEDSRTLTKIHYHNIDDNGYETLICTFE